MKEPTFKKGDVVEFELSKNGERPRWNYEMDYDGNGQYATGIVREAGEGSITVYSKDLQWDLWYWPSPGNPLSSPERWDWPGYLRHKQEALQEGTHMNEKSTFADRVRWVLDGGWITWSRPDRPNRTFHFDTSIDTVRDCKEMLFSLEILQGEPGGKWTFHAPPKKFTRWLAQSTDGNVELLSAETESEALAEGQEAFAKNFHGVISTTWEVPQ